jgi:hypothetical protein
MNQMKNIVFRVGAIILLALLSLVVSRTSLIKNFERQTVDYRFQLRGMKPVHPEVILVLIDDKTQRTIGHSFDSFRYFADIGSTLKKLGARVVGFDLLFNHQYPEVEEAVISNFFERCPDIIFPCYFYPLYYNELEKNTAEIDSAFRKFSWEIPGFGTNRLYYSTHVSPPHNTILQRLNCLGHINVSPDSLALLGYQIPLLIRYENTVYPALVLEILRQYFDLNVDQIEVSRQKMRLPVDTADNIEIPILKRCETRINYLGDWNVFEKNCYSFVDILKLSEKMKNAPLELFDYSIFKDKIVLVGSTNGPDIFSTPFSDNFPGVFLHATLLTNILENDFIYELSDFYTLLALFVPGLICAFLIFRLKRIDRFLLIVGLIGLYWLFCVVLFIGFGLILKVFIPTIFLMLHIIFIFEDEFGISYNPLKRLKLRFKQAKFKDILPERIKPDNIKPFIRIVISIIKMRDNNAIIHTIETEKDREHGLSAFHRSPQSQNPFNCTQESINKLIHEKEKLEEAYINYLQAECKVHLKPLELLKRIGEKVYYDFGLAATFKELPEFSGKDTYINFVVNDLSIPWHWAYHRESNTFLCDLFPISYSLAIERANLKNEDSGEHRFSTQFNKKAALFLYGTWSGEPEKELKEAEKEINSIQGFLKIRNQVVAESTNNVEFFLSKLTEFVSQGLNLRIIHYTGHIENSRLEVDPANFLEPGTIQGRGLHFHSRPIVFLNGCNSGNVGYLLDKYDDLATEFLASGAAACIVTNHDIIETTARRFSEIFYTNFIQKKLSVGEALRQTRIGLSNLKTKNKYDPACDITRYFYNLYGDPTVKF